MGARSSISVLQISNSFVFCRMRISFIIIIFCGLLASCKTKEREQPAVAVRDTTIRVENSFTELFTDSATLRQFVRAHGIQDSLDSKMQSFYNRRNYQFAWFFPDGMADFVHTFLSLQDDKNFFFLTFN